MGQEVIKIRVADLVLWTENPRDPIDETASDQTIVNKALHNDKRGKWEIKKLIKKMGKEYDLSELPTVVYKKGKPIVYDGNRRMIIAKLKLGYVTTDEDLPELPRVDEEIPCNVCDENTALENIFRKHGESGSWDPLERDIFLSKHMGHSKSPFLIIEECTDGFISQNPEMNQRFVRDEILGSKGLEELGFKIVDNHLEARHSVEETRVIFDDLRDNIKNKNISTRNRRGNPINALTQRSKDIIQDNTNKPFQKIYYTPTPKVSTKNEETKQRPRKTRKAKDTEVPFFGETRELEVGDINNLYRDILSLYDVVTHNRNYTKSVWAIFRMSLRLLVETAYKNLNLNLNEYISTYFRSAKSTLNNDHKTFLSNQNVSESSIIQLLQSGAHNYTSSLSVDQTIAMSIIVGAMLQLSHGKTK